MPEAHPGWGQFLEMAVCNWRMQVFERMVILCICENVYLHAHVEIRRFI